MTFSKVVTVAVGAVFGVQAAYAIGMNWPVDREQKR